MTDTKTDTTKPTYRLYNNFQSERVMGAQRYGNRIFIEEWSDEFNCWFFVPGTEQFVPCLTYFEPTTRNKIGTLGAHRDVPNQTRVDEIVKKLTNAYKLA